jgi:hypothetical protein
MTYITTATTTSVGSPGGLLITVNAALTGTITVTDGGTTKAIITNPGVGAAFRYHGFTGAAAIVTNAVCDITVNSINHQP